MIEEGGKTSPLSLFSLFLGDSHPPPTTDRDDDDGSTPQARLGRTEGRRRSLHLSSLLLSSNERKIPFFRCGLGTDCVCLSVLRIRQMVPFSPSSFRLFVSPLFLLLFLHFCSQWQFHRYITHILRSTANVLLFTFTLSSFFAGRAAKEACECTLSTKRRPLSMHGIDSVIILTQYWVLSSKISEI